MMQNLYDFTLQELTEIMQKMGYEKYRAKQIFDWLYKSRINSMNEMKNIPEDIIEKLKTDYDIFLPEIIKETKSETDETKKYLLKLKDENRIECVLIYNGERITLCASTQAGCACGCRFCSTATLGFKRNLDTGEIVSQIMLAMKMTDNKLTNVVFMGMGEPLLNRDNLYKAILILSDKNGLNFSQTRITVSTAGIVPVIKEIAESGLKINLAISLITADDEMRSKLMPINLKYPLKEVIRAAEYYNKKTGECITFECVLFGGINDSEKDAINLVEKLRKVNYKINLIPYNDSLNKEFTKPDDDKVKKFQRILKDNGIKVFIRKEKGADIKAACGQLAAEG
ncbi:MAG TPA: 23S rRNA (adenine(2503)-C(2))-methyltransferase RlmN [Candidatus Goldiibacteriota bacterium]|nr:23S rRNA (adenine(2503)-C(2))-methyltransferase RlmN [Candidatus Goldiibacteriota bacterium]